MIQLLNAIRAEPGEKSLRLIKWEIALTGAQLAASIAYLHIAKIGLGVQAIAEASIVMILVQLVFNIPAGIWADRYSQKWANVCGNTVAALGFFAFALSHSMTAVMWAYALVGIGNAISLGANYTLMMRHTAFEMGASDQHTLQSTLSRHHAEAKKLMFLAMGVGAIVMPVAVSVLGSAMAIVIVGFVYLVAATLSLRINDLNVSHVARPSLPAHIRDAVRHIATNKSVRPWIVAYLVAFLVWQPAISLLFTPALLMAGVPEASIGLWWAATIATMYYGARRAAEFTRDRESSNQEVKGFVVATLPAIIAAAILACGVNIWTICAYIGFGFSFGWSSALMMSSIQIRVEKLHATSVISAVMTLSMLIGAGLIGIYGTIAASSISLAMLWTAVPFALIVPIVAWWCRRSLKV